MEEDLNVKLREMVKGVRMANLKPDSALIDSDTMPTRLVHKMSASMPQSSQFYRRILHLVNAAGVDICPYNVLSRNISENGVEKLDVKKAVALSRTPESPTNNMPKTKTSQLSIKRFAATNLN
ncbi:hypothetical protein ACTXT7_013255 [Hymenolepis weldensis]